MSTYIYNFVYSLRFLYQSCCCLKNMKNFLIHQGKFVKFNLIDLFHLQIISILLNLGFTLEYAGLLHLFFVFLDYS